MSRKQEWKDWRAYTQGLQALPLQEHNLPSSISICHEEYREAKDAQDYIVSLTENTITFSFLSGDARLIALASRCLPF
jgi:hypothetical protein